MSGLPINPLPWSWTRLSQAQRCSYAFFLECGGLIGSQDRAERRPETRVGLVLHKIAKFLLDGSTSVEFTLGDDWMVPPEVFRSLGSFITNDLPQLKDLLGGSPQVFPELQIRLDENLQPVYGWPNGFIVGSIDLALLNEETHSAILLDYKTGETSGEKLMQFYRPQLELYALLFDQGHFPLEKVGLVIHSGATAKTHWLTDGLEPFDRAAAIASLQQEVTKALENTQTIQPTQNALCRYCSYRNMCPVYKEDLCPTQ